MGRPKTRKDGSRARWHSKLGRAPEYVRPRACVTTNRLDPDDPIWTSSNSGVFKLVSEARQRTRCAVNFCSAGKSRTSLLHILPPRLLPYIWSFLRDANTGSAAMPPLEANRVQSLTDSPGAVSSTVAFVDKDLLLVTQETRGGSSSMYLQICRGYDVYGPPPAALGSVAQQLLEAVGSSPSRATVALPWSSRLEAALTSISSERPSTT